VGLVYNPTINRKDNMSKEKIKHPEHLTPEIIQSALFIHNAEDNQDAHKRIQFLQNKFSDKQLSFIMAMLMLPYLMEIVEKSDEYKSYFENRKKTLN